MNTRNYTRWKRSQVWIIKGKTEDLNGVYWSPATLGHAGRIQTHHFSFLITKTKLNKQANTAITIIGVSITKIMSAFCYLGSRGDAWLSGDFVKILTDTKGRERYKLEGAL